MITPGRLIAAHFLELFAPVKAINLHSPTARRITELVNGLYVDGRGYGFDVEPIDIVVAAAEQGLELKFLRNGDLQVGISALEVKQFQGSPIYSQTLVGLDGFCAIEPVVDIENQLIVEKCAKGFQPPPEAQIIAAIGYLTTGSSTETLKPGALILAARRLKYEVTRDISTGAFRISKNRGGA